MKKLKKIAALLICVCIMCNFSACKNNDASSASKGYDYSKVIAGERDIDGNVSSNTEKETLNIWVISNRGALSTIEKLTNQFNLYSDIVELYEKYYLKDNYEELEKQFYRGFLSYRIDFEDLLKIYEKYSHEDIKRLYGLNYNINLEFAHDEYTNGRLSLTQADDAIRTLNARLLAGDGPDVIILDGCPAEQMANAGLLSDLESLAKKSGVYENIADALRTADGGLYYLPYKIDAPLIAGSADILNEVKDAHSLLELIKQYPPHTPYDEELANDRSDPFLLKLEPLPESEKTLLAMTGLSFSLEPFMLELYYNEITENNSLNTEALAEMYALTNEYKNALQMLRLENRYFPSMDIRGYAKYMPVYSGGSGMSYYTGYSHIAVESSAMLRFDFLAFTALAKGYTDMQVRPFPAENAVFTPNSLMAINKNSDKHELAEDFLEKIFTVEMQLETIGLGSLPVTKDSVRAFTEKHFSRELKDYYQSTFENEEDSEMAKQLEWFVQDIEFPYDLDGLLQSFDTACITNEAVYGAIYNGLSSYNDEYSSLEEVVQSCENALKLYFAEKQ